MELKKTDIKDVTCDIGVCQNHADIVLTGEGVCVQNELRMCASCAEKLRKSLNLYLKRVGENGKV